MTTDDSWLDLSLNLDNMEGNIDCDNNDPNTITPLKTDTPSILE
eukprot:CAMPEP_0114671212 /NCGR_PEP_ID=MMETSP0191-20121206/40785_1 /TAXON_ID=126664 /ORGANISM="Sorites sp." /LENGTH=43 /DNA_ID= /DNA_START= /DNA_END= /DNA_ORIENTATION=